MGPKLRLSALMAGAALVLHQLRYLAGHGDGAGEAVAAQGHAYFSLLVPLVSVLLVAAAAHLLLLALGSGGPKGRTGRPFAVRATAIAVLLLAIYSGQELLEGLLFAGHPSGVDALLAHDGWVVLPLAAGLGLVVAALLRGADAILAACSRRSGRPRRRHGASSGRTGGPLGWSRAGVLAEKLASRAPPAAPS